MSKSSFFILVSLAATLGLSGCKDAPEPVQSKTVTTPGKITVVTPPSAVTQQRTGDAFRSYDVHGESQIKYAPEGTEITDAVKNVQVVVAARNNPYASIQAALMAKRLSKEFIVLCSACHDDYGNGVIGPSLIGKSATDVRTMIDKYSGDPNANVLMTDLVHRMDNRKIDFICEDIARFNAEVQKEAAQDGKNWLLELTQNRRLQ